MLLFLAGSKRLLCRRNSRFDPHAVLSCPIAIELFLGLCQSETIVISRGNSLGLHTMQEGIGIVPCLQGRYPILLLQATPLLMLKLLGA